MLLRLAFMLLCVLGLLGCPQGGGSTYTTAAIERGFHTFSVFSELFGPRHVEDDMMSWPASPQDVYQVKDNLLYTSSSERGMSIIDYENAVVLSQFKTDGAPRMLLVENGIAYMVVALKSNHQAVKSALVYDIQSVLYILDVSDPTSPHLLSQTLIKGNIRRSAIMGSIFCAVSTVYAALDSRSPLDQDPDLTTWITTVDVSDPFHPRVVDRLEASSYERYIDAENGWVFLAYQNDARLDDTWLRFVDVSDPDGKIRQGGAVNIPGGIVGENSLDVWEGAVRVASHQPQESSYIASPVITTIDPTQPVRPLILDQLMLRAGEGKSALKVSFEKERGVVISKSDTLYVLDLSDPAHIAVTWESPPSDKWNSFLSTYDHLASVNRTYEQGVWSEWVQWSSLDGTAGPVRIDRLSSALLGLSYYEDTGFERLDDGLLAIHRHALDGSEHRTHASEVVDLIQLQSETLQPLGKLAVYSGQLFARADSVYSVSRNGLQIYKPLNAPNTALLNPSTELILNDMVMDVVEIGPDLLAQLVERHGMLPENSVTGVRLAKRDGTPLGWVAVNEFSAFRFLKSGSSVILVSSNYSEFDIARVDCSDPTQPYVSNQRRIRGGADCADSGVSAGIPLRGSNYSSTLEITRLRHDKRAFMAGERLIVRCSAWNDFDVVVGEGTITQGFLVIEPESLEVLAKVGIGYEGVGSLTAAGDSLVLCTGKMADNALQFPFTPLSFNPMNAYSARKISLDPVVAGPEISVPGVIIRYEPENSLLLLRDMQWDGAISWKSYLRTVKWDGQSKTSLLDSIEIPKHATVAWQAGRGYTFYRYTDSFSAYSLSSAYIGAVRITASGKLAQLGSIKLPVRYVFPSLGVDAKLYLDLLGGVAVYDWSSGEAKLTHTVNFMGQPIAVRSGEYGVYAPLSWFGMAVIK